ncbi:hypothetical protein BaRGS_00030228 [Batillaria attramentaria]|uniref:Uncharacterized protein n=1 Tax=Batillaria attramentaria TaxID=370345 RepID=A0ABD0JV36_9CAEN
MANPLPRQSQTQGTAAGTPSVIKDGTEDNSASLQDPATLRTVLVNTCTTYLVTTSNLQQYFTNTADSSGGPVERVVQLDWYTYVIYFYNHEDAVNVVCRDNHECGAVYLSVFLYDEQSRSVYTVSQDKNPRKRSVHAVDVPVVAREASATVLVTGLNPHIPNTALIREINKLLDKGRHPMPNTKRLHDTWMAFLQYQRHEGQFTNTQWERSAAGAAVESSVIIHWSACF